MLKCLCLGLVTSGSGKAVKSKSRFKFKLKLFAPVSGKISESKECSKHWYESHK
jgi:hypothetical protein